MSFAERVRQSVERHFPDFVHFETTPGPGTWMTFRRPRKTPHGMWLQELVIQRSKFGDSFRLILARAPVDERRCCHGFGRRPSTFDEASPSDSWFDDNSVKLSRHLAKVDREIAAEAKRYHAASKCCDTLPALYVRWYVAEAKGFTADAFAPKGRNLQIGAQEGFWKFVRAKVKNRQCVDSFWQGGRARRREELDPRLVQAYCSVCERQKPITTMKLQLARHATLGRAGLVEYTCKKKCRR